jgi:hypothetical protein
MEEWRAVAADYLMTVRLYTLAHNSCSHFSGLEAEDLGAPIGISGEHYVARTFSSSRGVEVWSSVGGSSFRPINHEVIAKLLARWARVCGCQEWRGCHTAIWTQIPSVPSTRIRG